MSEESQYQPIYVNSMALVIGVNEYADPRFPPLGNAEQDARNMAELLSGPRFQFKVTTLLNTEATRQNIMAALFNLRSCGPDDRVVVYFAGHGYTLVDRFDHETGYLATFDTVPEQDFTALQMDEVTDLRLNAQAKHIAFIFDACFSGQALGLTRAAAVTAEKFLTRRSYQIISAGAGDQTVSDFQSMTTRLIEALTGNALDEDGLITFSEVGLYLRETVAADTGQTQIPQFGHIRGSQGGDFVFLLDSAPRLPIELLDGIRSTRANTRMGAVVDLIDLARGEDEDLAKLARQKLRHIWQEDKDKKVREAAQVFFFAGDASGAKSTGTGRRRDLKLVLEREKPAALEAALDALAPDVSDTELEAKVLAEQVAQEAAENAEDAAKPQYIVDATKGTSQQTAVSQSTSGAAKRSASAPAKPAAKPKVKPSITSAVPTWIWVAVPIAAVAIIGGIILASGALSPEPEPTSIPTIAETETSTEAPTSAPDITGTSTEVEVVVPPTETATAAPTPFGGSVGPLVFASEIGGNLELFTTSPDGSGRVNITNSPSRDENPKWSPDGTKILFVSNKEGNRDIYVMNADGTNLINLSNSGREDVDPAWSADGSKIAFISDRDGNPDVFTMNADGTQSVNITRSNVAEASPTWSPDGSKIAFSALSGAQRDIFIVNADGSGKVNPTNNGADDIQPSWSPDGSKIAFVSYRDGNWEIYVMAATGSGVLRLTQEKFDDFYPSWSPDGAYILFNATITGRHQLYRVKFDGSDLAIITTSTSTDTQVSWKK